MASVRAPRAPRAARPLRRRTALAAVALLAGAAGLPGLGGCAPEATYPAIDGAISIANPRLAPLPELMARAVADGHEQAGGGDRPIRFNLPPETPYAVWNEVITRLGPDSGPARPGDDPVIHVMQVRVAGLSGEVDTVRRHGGAPQLTTLEFRRRALSDWRMERREWRFDVDEPQLTWVDPPPPGTGTRDDDDQETPVLAAPSTRPAPVAPMAPPRMTPPAARIQPVVPPATAEPVAPVQPVLRGVGG